MIFYLIQYSFFILIFITIIIMVLTRLKKVNKVYERILIPLTIFVLVMVYVINFDWDSYEEMNFIVKGEPELSLTVKEKDGRSFLFDENQNDEVKYKPYWTTNKEKIQDDYNVVYFKALEQYYLVIFSENSTKTYTNRFLVGDHERERGDLLYVIDKEDGFMYLVSATSLSGYEVDLSSFKVEGEIVYYGVYLKYETGISHYRYLVIPDNIEKEDYSSQTWRNNRDQIWIRGDVEGGSNHVHTLGDPSEITTFILNEKTFLYIDSYDIIRVGRYTRSNNDLRLDGKEFLTGEQYIIDGQYELIDGILYYLSNDLELRKFTNNFATSTVKEDVTLDNWRDFIPVN